jgi:hypothetical protein
MFGSSSTNGPTRLGLGYHEQNETDFADRTVGRILCDLTPPKQQAPDCPAQMKTPAGVRCTGGSWLIADAGFIRDASIDRLQLVEIRLPVQPPAVAANRWRLHFPCDRRRRCTSSSLSDSISAFVIRCARKPGELRELRGQSHRFP